MFINSKQAIPLMLATLALSACGGGSKNNKTSVAVADEVTLLHKKLGISAECAAFSTPSQADAENKVVEDSPDYDFNLYWMGPRAEIISFWENQGSNSLISVTKTIPLNIILKRERDSSVIETLSCVDDFVRCHAHLVDIQNKIKGRRHDSEKTGVALREGTEKTFKCVSEFVDFQIEILVEENLSEI